MQEKTTEQQPYELNTTMEQENRAMTGPSPFGPSWFLSEQSISKKCAYMGEEVTLFFGYEVRKKWSQMAGKLGDKWTSIRNELNRTSHSKV